jgi:hypothetical protein
MVKVHGYFVWKPQGFGFDSRKNREREVLPEFFIRTAWTDRSGVRGDALTVFSASGKQARRSCKNLKSLRRGEGAGYFDKPTTTRLRVRIPPTTQVVVAQWKSIG